MQEARNQGAEERNEVEEARVKVPQKGNEEVEERSQSSAEEL